MADAIQFQLRLDDSQAVRTIENLRNLTRKDFQMNLNVNSRPLGVISRQLSEFDKSLEAANARVLAFGATTGAIYGVQKAFSTMIGDVIEVEKALKNVQTILNATDSDLQKFGTGIFEVANKTGQSFKVASDAALEFSRQGLGLQQTLKATEAALILTRISGLDASQAVSSLTSAVNTFTEAGLSHIDVVDKIVSVDLKFAVSAADLAEGLRRVGATAVDSKVSLDELNAAITSVQQVTARGGAVIGNAFKSIFTRLQRPKVQETLEGLGVQTKDANGEFRNSISVLQDLARVYDRLSDAQKSVVSETVAGIYQVNTFKALLRTMSGGEMSLYSQALNESQNASSGAAKRNEELNQSLAALIQRTRNAATEFNAAFAQGGMEDGVKRLVGYINNAFKTLTGFTSRQGDFKNIGEFIGSSISQGIGNIISGPLPIMVGFLLSKTFARVFGEKEGLFGAIKNIAGIQTLKEKQLMLEKQIDTVLRNSDQKILDQLQNTTSLTERQKIFNRELDITLAKQEQHRNLIRSLTGAMFAEERVQMLMGKAVTNQATSHATGYIPNYATGTGNAFLKESLAISKGVGGASKHAKPAPRNIVMNGKLTPSVLNTDEYLVHGWMGGKDSAVLNPNMVKSIGRGNLNKLGRVEKVTAANGFVPSYANVYGSGGVKFSSVEKLPKDLINYLNRLSDDKKINALQEILTSNKDPRKFSYYLPPVRVGNPKDMNAWAFPSDSLHYLKNDEYRKDFLEKIFAKTGKIPGSVGLSISAIGSEQSMQNDLGSHFLAHEFGHLANSSLLENMGNRYATISKDPGFRKLVDDFYTSKDRKNIIANKTRSYLDNFEFGTSKFYDEAGADIFAGMFGSLHRYGVSPSNAYEHAMNLRQSEIGQYISKYTGTENFQFSNGYIPNYASAQGFNINSGSIYMDRKNNAFAKISHPEKGILSANRTGPMEKTSLVYRLPNGSRLSSDWNPRKNEFDIGRIDSNKSGDAHKLFSNIVNLAKERQSKIFNLTFTPQGGAFSNAEAAGASLSELGYALHPQLRYRYGDKTKGYAPLVKQIAGSLNYIQDGKKFDKKYTWASYLKAIKNADRVNGVPMVSIGHFLDKPLAEGFIPNYANKVNLTGKIRKEREGATLLTGNLFTKDISLYGQKLLMNGYPRNVTSNVLSLLDSKSSVSFANNQKEKSIYMEYIQSNKSGDARKLFENIVRYAKKRKSTIYSDHLFQQHSQYFEARRLGKSLEEQAKALIPQLNYRRGLTKDTGDMYATVNGMSQRYPYSWEKYVDLLGKVDFEELAPKIEVQNLVSKPLAKGYIPNYGRRPKVRYLTPEELAARRAEREGSNILDTSQKILENLDLGNLNPDNIDLRIFGIELENNLKQQPKIHLKDKRVVDYINQRVEQNRSIDFGNISAMNSVSNDEILDIIFRNKKLFSEKAFNALKSTTLSRSGYSKASGYIPNFALRQFLNTHKPGGLREFLKQTDKSYDLTNFNQIIESSSRFPTFNGPLNEFLAKKESRENFFKQDRLSFTRGSLKNASNYFSKFTREDMPSVVEAFMGTMALNKPERLWNVGRITKSIEYFINQRKKFPNDPISDKFIKKYKAPLEKGGTLKTFLSQTGGIEKLISREASVKGIAQNSPEANSLLGDIATVFQNNAYNEKARTFTSVSQFLRKGGSGRRSIEEINFDFRDVERRPELAVKGSGRNAFNTATITLPSSLRGGSNKDARLLSLYEGAGTLLRKGFKKDPTKSYEFSDFLVKAIESAQKGELKGRIGEIFNQNLPKEEYFDKLLGELLKSNQYYHHASSTNKFFNSSLGQEFHSIIGSDLKSSLLPRMANGYIPNYAAKLKINSLGIDFATKEKSFSADVMERLTDIGMDPGFLKIAASLPKKSLKGIRISDIPGANGSLTSSKGGKSFIMNLDKSFLKRATEEESIFGATHEILHALDKSSLKKGKSISENNKSFLRASKNKGNYGQHWFLKQKYDYYKDVKYSENEILGEIFSDIGAFIKNPKVSQADKDSLLKTKLGKEFRKSIEKSTYSGMGLFGSFAGGFIPNFAFNPMKEAINREISALVIGGVSPYVAANSIRVEKSEALSSPQNPFGLAITNTRQQPGGLSQARSQHSNDVGKSMARLAQGNIPNYASMADVMRINIQKALADNPALAGNDEYKIFADLQKEIALKNSGYRRWGGVSAPGSYDKHISNIESGNYSTAQPSIKALSDLSMGDTKYVTRATEELVKVFDRLSVKIGSEVTPSFDDLKKMAEQLGYHKGEIAKIEEQGKKYNSLYLSDKDAKSSLVKQRIMETGETENQAKKYFNSSAGQKEIVDRLEARTKDSLDRRMAFQKDIVTEQQTQAKIVKIREKADPDIYRQLQKNSTTFGGFFGRSSLKNIMSGVKFPAFKDENGEMVSAYSTQEKVKLAKQFRSEGAEKAGARRQNAAFMASFLLPMAGAGVGNLLGSAAGGPDTSKGRNRIEAANQVSTGIATGAMVASMGGGPITMAIGATIAAFATLDAVLKAQRENYEVLQKEMENTSKKFQETSQAAEQFTFATSELEELLKSGSATSAEVGFAAKRKAESFGKIDDSKLRNDLLNAGNDKVKIAQIQKEYRDKGNREITSKGLSADLEKTIQDSSKFGRASLTQLGVPIDRPNEENIQRLTKDIFDSLDLSKITPEIAKSLVFDKKTIDKSDSSSGNSFYFEKLKKAGVFSNVRNTDMEKLDQLVNSKTRSGAPESTTVGGLVAEDLLRKILDSQSLKEYSKAAEIASKSTNNFTKSLEGYINQAEFAIKIGNVKETNKSKVGVDLASKIFSTNRDLFTPKAAAQTNYDISLAQNKVQFEEARKGINENLLGAINEMVSKKIGSPDLPTTQELNLLQEAKDNVNNLTALQNIANKVENIGKTSEDFRTNKAVIDSQQKLQSILTELQYNNDIAKNTLEADLRIVREAEKQKGILQRQAFASDIFGKDRNTITQDAANETRARDRFSFASRSESQEKGREVIRKYGRNSPQYAAFVNQEGQTDFEQAKIARQAIINRIQNGIGILDESEYSIREDFAKNDKSFDNTKTLTKDQQKKVEEEVKRRKDRNEKVKAPLKAQFREATERELKEGVKAQQNSVFFTYNDLISKRLENSTENDVYKRDRDIIREGLAGNKPEIAIASLQKIRGNLVRKQGQMGGIGENDQRALDTVNRALKDMTDLQTQRAKIPQTVDEETNKLFSDKDNPSVKILGDQLKVQTEIQRILEKSNAAQDISMKSDILNEKVQQYNTHLAEGVQKESQFQGKKAELDKKNSEGESILTNISANKDILRNERKKREALIGIMPEELKKIAPKGKIEDFLAGKIDKEEIFGESRKRLERLDKLDVNPETGESLEKEHRLFAKIKKFEQSKEFGESTSIKSLTQGNTGLIEEQGGNAFTTLEKVYDEKTGAIRKTLGLVAERRNTLIDQRNKELAKEQKIGESLRGEVKTAQENVSGARGNLPLEEVPEKMWETPEEKGKRDSIKSRLINPNLMLDPFDKAHIAYRNELALSAEQFGTDYEKFPQKVKDNLDQKYFNLAKIAKENSYSMLGTTSSPKSLNKKDYADILDSYRNSPVQEDFFYLEEDPYKPIPVGETNTQKTKQPLTLNSLLSGLRESTGNYLSESNYGRSVLSNSNSLLKNKGIYGDLDKFPALSENLDIINSKSINLRSFSKTARDTFSELGVEALSKNPDESKMNRLIRSGVGWMSDTKGFSSDLRSRELLQDKFNNVIQSSNIPRSFKTGDVITTTEDGKRVTRKATEKDVEENNKARNAVFEEMNKKLQAIVDKSDVGKTQVDTKIVINQQTTAKDDEELLKLIREAVLKAVSEMENNKAKLQGKVAPN